MSSPAGGREPGLGVRDGVSNQSLHAPGTPLAPRRGNTHVTPGPSPLSLPLASCLNLNILIKIDSVGSVEPGKPAADPALGAWALNICFLLKALWKRELPPRLPPLGFSPFGGRCAGLAFQRFVPPLSLPPAQLKFCSNENKQTKLIATRPASGEARVSPHACFAPAGLGAEDGVSALTQQGMGTKNKKKWALPAFLPHTRLSIAHFPDKAVGWKAGGQSTPDEALSARGLLCLRNVAVVFQQRVSTLKLLRFLGGSSSLYPLSDLDESFPDSV